MLEEMLNILGCEHPFAENGELTKEGAIALNKAVRVGEMFALMGLVEKNCRSLEDACDEIVDRDW